MRANWPTVVAAPTPPNVRRRGATPSPRARVGQLARAVGLALGLTPSGEARGESVEVVSLQWKAPSGCPEEAAVAALLRESAVDTAPVTAKGAITGGPGSYRLILQIDTKATHGERVLEGRDCKALTESAIVIVRMAMANAAREAASTRATESATAPRPQPSTPTPPTPPTRSAAGAEGSTERRVRFAVRPEAALDVGTLPALAPNFGLAVGVQLLAFRAEAYGALSTSQRKPVSDAVSASFDVAAMGLRGCADVLQGRTRLGACVGVEGSGISGRAAGVARQEDLRSGVASGRLDAFLAVGLIPPWLDVRLGAGLAAPTRRESFVIVPFGQVHERGPVALKAWVGPEFRL